jgi:hypothetical protein
MASVDPAAGLVAAAVLVGLVLVAGLSGTHGVRGAALLAGVSVLWLLVNQPMEGIILFQFPGPHGLTGADLAGFAGLVLAAVRARRATRR